MYGETLNFQCPHQQWYYKIPDRKINFCSKFAVKTLPVTVANADIGSLKSLHTLFDKFLDHMLVNLDQIVWAKLHEVVSFWGKKNIFDKALTPF